MNPGFAAHLTCDLGHTTDPCERGSCLPDFISRTPHPTPVSPFSPQWFSFCLSKIPSARPRATALAGPLLTPSPRGANKHYNLVPARFNCSAPCVPACSSSCWTWQLKSRSTQLTLSSRETAGMFAQARALQSYVRKHFSSQRS